MKKIIIITILPLIINFKMFAQPCTANIFNMTNVFVFSTTRNYTPDEIYGQQINSALFNVHFISTQDKKHETDSMVLINRLENSIFIFPNHDAAKTIRYCNQIEYAEALKKNTGLKISDE